MDVRTHAEPREMLDQLIRERGEDYASISRLLGRNAAYVQQFIKRGTPKRLVEEDRRTLARYFGVPESALGASAEARPPLQNVPRLDVRASAGHGALGSLEIVADQMGFSDRLLRELAGGNPSGLSMIRVSGDSMSPTLDDGDDIMINRFDDRSRLRDGIYVLRMSDDLFVKRVCRGPDPRRIRLVSDNAAYPEWAVELKDVTIIGRLVWSGKRFR